VVIMPQNVRATAEPQQSRVTGKSDSINVERVDAAAYTVPTEQPESDGTHSWDSTTMVIVQIGAGGRTGIGYTYTNRAAAELIRSALVPVILDRDITTHPALWRDMVRALRNFGTSGIGASAISAVDNALWDLKARLLGVPLVTLLGHVRDSVPVYGSGGFTSQDETRLRRQLEGWVTEGIRSVKMKVGLDAQADLHRVELARRTIGDNVELMVDANGAYTRKQALRMAHDFAAQGVNWFEEPVTSDDLRGLRLLRDRVPAGMEVAAGEYGWDMASFRRMLLSGAADVLQPDVTRCMGITGFMAAAALAEAWHIPVSAHAAPAQSLHVCCAVRPMRHIEWFHDHVRVESLLLDGSPRLDRGGTIRPDMGRAGNGLALRRDDAEKYRTS
jgi:L-alanine-DL-glutamate epimerase-like enolase superfamily enzyme